MAALVAAAAMTVGCGEPEDDGPSQPTNQTAEFALSPAASCDDVRDQVAQTLTEEVLDMYYQEYYWRGDIDMADGQAEPSAGDAPESDSPSEYTDTNVQEEGVDEPDIVKTDGTHIYAVVDNSLQILKSWPPQDTARVGRYDLPDGVRPSSLFLDGDIVAVFSQMWGRYRYEPGLDGEVDSRDEYDSFSGTRISIFDVSDRSEPVPVRQLDIEGRYVDGRMVGGKVYLVTNSSLRGLNAWSYYDVEIEGIPQRDSETTTDELEEMREEARPVVYAFLRDELQERDPQEWLPRQRIVDGDNEVVLSGPLHECTGLYLPQVAAELGILNISSFDMTDKTQISSTGLLARGWDVYASQSSLYIAMSSRAWMWWGWGNQENESHIHKFSLPSSGQPQYQASGRVDGWILNQFSFSEYDGHLRVATTDNRWAHNPETGEFEDEGGNHIIVLKKENGELVETGSVRDLAPTERVYSARFMGEKGYVVTFRETDPFYTIDLSDPTNPQMIGELKIEGFSSYMHPLDENHLLAIGREGDEFGNMSGVHLQVFDVSDFADPVRTHHEVISTGNWSSHSEAMWNHHAFTYQSRLGVLGIPMSIWDDGDQFSGLMLFDATVDGIEEIGRVDHSDLVAQSWCLRNGQDADCNADTNHWWSSMRRSIMMSGDNDSEEYVYSLSSVGLKVSKTFEPEQDLASVLLRE